MPRQVIVTFMLIFFPVSLTIPENFVDLLNELNGAHLRFSAHPVPYLLTIRKDRNGTFIYEGFTAEVVEFIAYALNITYSFVRANDTEADLIGPREAAINLLMRQEVDIVSYGMKENIDVCTRMDCSFPLMPLTAGMMVPWPEEKSRLLAPIQPFEPMVWLCVFFTCLAMIFLLVWLPGFYFNYVNIDRKNLVLHPASASKPIINFKDLGNAVVYVATIYTNQGNSVRFKQLSFRIVVATFCLTALVLVNAYAGTLISFLTVPTLKPVTKTLDDLAANRYQNLLLLVQKNSVTADLFFLNGDSGYRKVLGDSLRKHPENLFANQKKGFEMMYTGRFAYVAAEQFLDSFLDVANKKAGYCKFTISSRNLAEIGVIASFSVYNFPKHWRYTAAVNYKLQYWWDSGLMPWWVKKYRPNTEQCSIENYKKKAAAKQKSLKIMDLLSAFVVLLLGCALSVLVFLVECIVALARHHNNRL